MELARPVRRYEHERPRELIRIDIEKLGKLDQIGGGKGRSRGVGREPIYVHVDSASRIVFTQIKPNGPKRRDVTLSPEVAAACHASLDVTVERVMIDNG